jgi:hypothetical protein
MMLDACGTVENAWGGSVAEFWSWPGGGIIGAGLIAVMQSQAFKGPQFVTEVILLAVRWYLM